MKYLLDTHLLLWSSYEPQRLSPASLSLITDPANHFVFSAASIWEIAIKAAKHPSTFHVDPDVLRIGLLNLGYAELAVTSKHGAETLRLPLIHRDPFDRLLIAQAIVENLTLLTVDKTLVAYSSNVRYVG